MKSSGVVFIKLIRSDSFDYEIGQITHLSYVNVNIIVAIYLLKARLLRLSKHGSTKATLSIICRLLI